MFKLVRVLHGNSPIAGTPTSQSASRVGSTPKKFPMMNQNFNFNKRRKRKEKNATDPKNTPAPAQDEDPQPQLFDLRGQGLQDVPGLFPSPPQGRRVGGRRYRGQPPAAAQRPAPLRLGRAENKRDGGMSRPLPLLLSPIQLSDMVVVII